MELLSTLKKFKQKRILVIGDLILDHYVYGVVARISPEAPVPIVDVTSDEHKLGGAANVAHNIVSLGGQATTVGIVGKDGASEVLEELLRERGIDFIAIEDKRPTTVKTRVIAHSQQVVRFDHEEKEKLSGKVLKGLVEYILKAVPEHDAVVLSDYKKGVVTPEVIKAVLKASGSEKLVAVDPKVGHFPLYKGVSVITPNVMEASQGSAVEIRDERTLLRAGRALIKKLGVRAVLLTRGEEGMSLFQEDGVIHIPTLARKVYDVTGAGDTVIASFALAYAAGASLQDSAVFANHAAGVVVGEVGTAVATPARVRQSIKAAKINVERVRF
jgi:D-beta-D-heptose 7-phosphate kinase/D-beta-D-heptose 1-phosphate adenosyltransferase